MGTGTNPPSARLHVSGGDAYFTDTVTVGYNDSGIGRIYFGPSPLLYINGDLNVNEIRVKSQFGNAALEGNNHAVEVSSNGLEYKRFGTTFFQVTPNQLLYRPTLTSGFYVNDDGGFYSNLWYGAKFNITYTNIGAGIVKQFSIDPQNGFDIYTGSVQLLGIKENGNVQVGSLTNPNSVLEVTGSVQVSGSIYTNGTNIQSLSIAYAIALG